jgi:hypothetical protein
MKRLKSVTLCVFTALVLAPVHAEDNNRIRIHVPFPFFAAGKALPAGDYVLQENSESGVVMVHGRGQAGSVALLTRSVDSKAADEPGAKFVTIDGQKHLDQIDMNDGTARAPLSRTSK